MADAIRSAAAELVTIVLNQCGGYLSGPGFEAAQAARKLREALVEQPAQGEAVVRATVIKRGAERTWMSERMGELPDGTYSLYTAPPAPAVPDGWKLVPVKMTDEMGCAAPAVSSRSYAALLAAAPEVKP